MIPSPLARPGARHPNPRLRFMRTGPGRESPGLSCPAAADDALALAVRGSCQGGNAAGEAALEGVVHQEAAVAGRGVHHHLRFAGPLRRRQLRGHTRCTASAAGCPSSLRQVRQQQRPRMQTHPSGHVLPDTRIKECGSCIGVPRAATRHRAGQERKAPAWAPARQEQRRLRQDAQM